MYSSNRHNQKHTVAHNWAHQLQSKYKKDTVAGSLYYDGKTIYSYGYHFPIATIHEDKKRGDVTFFTTRGYSNTTAKHISAVRSACSHHTIIFCANPDEAARAIHHGNNLQAWENTCKNIAHSLPKAKKPEKYLASIAYQREQAQAYAAYFGITLTAKKFPYLFIESRDGGNKACTAELKRVAKERAKKEKETKQLFEIQLQCFRNFEAREHKYYDGIDGVHNPDDRNAAYLRYNKKSKRIETSKGIQIPTEIGKRFYHWLQSKIKKGGCETCDCNYRILNYSVEYVNANEFKVGCHTIQMSEAATLAKQLKW